MTYNNTYTPTVYEKIATDILNGNLQDFSKYKTEFTERGWNEKHFNAYVKDLKYIKTLMSAENFNLRSAITEAKNHHPTKDDEVLYFALTPDEKKIVLEAENNGSFKDGEIDKYQGYDREIKGYNYLNLPANTDAFVIFSGHPGSATPAIEAWLTDLKKTGNPKKVIFLGLHDNQGNTNFNDTNLKYNVDSEAEMYRRICHSLGMPKCFIDECIVEVTDISTEDNIEILASARDKYFSKDRDVNFAMFGYPAYQKRIATEFAYAFQNKENNHKVSGTNFIIPVVPQEQQESKRYLSYDNLNGIAQDIIIGNCVAHPFRISAGGRFDANLGKYPQKFKPLLPISLVYSYPNVANELAGTDTNVATMLKIHRAIQHKVYNWENPQVIDASIQYTIHNLRNELAKKGFQPYTLRKLCQRIDKLTDTEYKKQYAALKKSYQGNEFMQKLTHAQTEINQKGRAAFISSLRVYWKQFEKKKVRNVRQEKIDYNKFIENTNQR